MYEVVDHSTANLGMSENHQYLDEETDCEIIEDTMDPNLENDIMEDDEEDFEGDKSGEDNAVSFLTGFISKNEPDTEVIKIRKIKAPTKHHEEDDGLNDPSRKHVCNVCNKRFQKRSNLIDHLRLHANVKIYSCEFCEKSFVQAGNYKAHLRTHTKEK